MGAYDLVTATGFLHYLRRPEVAFEHARRLLSDDGYLLVTAPARWLLWLRERSVPGLHEANTRIRQRITVREWSRLAQGCGFRTVHRQGVQWTGQAATAGIERWLRRRGWLSAIAGSHLLVLQPGQPG
jgi:SAM-dependent methyltransferase